ncbi:stage III sporulation protein AF [Ligaoa zhengdingensis]|uniref:stage III sporulation protein AF n=1 Tax=Ligaoa zhengdingensis TaxID=2763658 RepID=UPI0031BB1E03
MEAIRDWALAVCVAAVAGSIAHLASPAGATQKIFRITVSVFFLCCMLSPILSGALSGDFQFDVELTPQTSSNTDEMQSTMEQQITDSFTASLRRLVEDELEEQGVRAEEISININTGEDGGISIREIVLLLKAEDQNKQAGLISGIKEKLGIEPVIEYRQEVKTQDGGKVSDGTD